MFKSLIKQVSRYAGIEIFRVSKEQFRWSHTVGDYYPVMPRPRWQQGTAPHTHLHRVLNQNRTEYQAFLDALDNNSDLIHGVDHKQKADDSDVPYWNNTWFTALDAAALINFIALKRPMRYIEIGSGHSTRFARYAISALRLDTKITSIDPVPRKNIDRICDRIIRSPLEACDLSIFDELKADDILFFDGSHRAFSNSDVVIFFFEVIPRLKPGVIIHIHDIFIPDDYPEQWNNRLYNEQYILAAMLTGGGKLPFRVIAPLAFICRDEFLSVHVKRTFTSRTGNPDIPFLYKNDARNSGTSFWLEMEGIT